MNYMNLHIFITIKRLSAQQLHTKKYIIQQNKHPEPTSTEHPLDPPSKRDAKRKINSLVEEG